METQGNANMTDILTWTRYASGSYGAHPDGGWSYLAALNDEDPAETWVLTIHHNDRTIVTAGGFVTREFAQADAEDEHETATLLHGKYGLPLESAHRLLATARTEPVTVSVRYRELTIGRDEGGYTVDDVTRCTAACDHDKGRHEPARDSTPHEANVTQAGGAGWQQAAPADGYLVWCPHGCGLGLSAHAADREAAQRRVDMHRAATTPLNPRLGAPHEANITGPGDTPEHITMTWRVGQAGRAPLAIGVTDRAHVWLGERITDAGDVNWTARLNTPEAVAALLDAVEAARTEQARIGNARYPLPGQIRDVLADLPADGPGADALAVAFAVRARFGPHETNTAEVLAELRNMEREGLVYRVGLSGGLARWAFRHAGLAAHGGLVEHSHEVRPDHEGVAYAG